MKHLFVAVSVIIASSWAHASVPQNAELCALEIYEEAEALFTETTVFDIKKATSISPFYLSLVNKNFADSGVQFATFADLKKAFSRGGDWQFDDLYILKRVSKKTGRTHLEVRSYPGDNPVGTVFHPVTGEILAVNSDDSYELINPEGSFSCYEINKEKY